MDAPPREADRQTFERVPQLAHVAVPLTFRQARQRVLVDCGRREAQSALDDEESCPGEGQHVRAARSQWRHVQVHHVEPEVQVHSKASGSNVFAQIPTRRGHDPRGHPKRFRATDPLELTVLQHAKQRGLQARCELADFVEKEGPACGALEAPFPPRHRPGEGAALVAEQLALHHRWRERCAIRVHEGTAPTLRHPVQDAGGQTLSHTRLTREENRRVQRCHICDCPTQ